MSNIFIRTAIMYAVVTVGLRLMGKRQISQMQPIELVIALMISDVGSVALQSTNFPLLYGIIPVITLISLEIVLSFCCMKSAKFRQIAYGAPQIIVRDGVPDVATMRALRFNLDDLYESLRLNQIEKIEDVAYAFIETCGQLSVMPKKAVSPPAAAEMGIELPERPFVPTLLIKDGLLIKNALKKQGLDEAWLSEKLRENGAESAEAVFLMALNADGTISVVKKR